MLDGYCERRRELNASSRSMIANFAGLRASSADGDDLRHRRAGRRARVLQHRLLRLARGSPRLRPSAEHVAQAVAGNWARRRMREVQARRERYDRSPSATGSKRARAIEADDPRWGHIVPLLQVTEGRDRWLRCTLRCQCCRSATR